MASSKRIQIGNFIIESFEIAQSYAFSKTEWFVDQIMGVHANGGLDLKTVRVFNSEIEARTWAARRL